MFGAKQVINWYQIGIGNRISLIQGDINKLNDQIKDYDQLLVDARELQEKLTQVENLLGQHIYWTKVFDALQKYTIDEVFFTNFAASQGGGLTMSAIGRDYHSVARQLKSFQEASDFISEVEIGSASASRDPETKEILFVEFDVNVRFQPEIFYVRFEKQE